jgi:nitroimidazol reductase NimA-like FMN-containing flavoprotein (pyridoxamine 5'-phosphate oxidase superfamily)
MARDRNGLEVLSDDECLRRLGRGGVGRVAISIGALPAVFPVNYALHRGDVVFRTTPGTKLWAATHEAVVAFEVDRIDPFAHTGWSVMVVGVAHRISDAAEIDAIRELPLSRWAGAADDESAVRIATARISGRELTHAAADPGGGAAFPLDACPRCGSDALEMVSDGETANVVCLSCLACWHMELGAVYPVGAGSCPGCRLRQLCGAARGA